MFHFFCVTCLKYSRVYEKSKMKICDVKVLLLLILLAGVFKINGSCPCSGTLTDVDSAVLCLKKIIDHGELFDESCLADLIETIHVDQHDNAELMRKAIERVNNGNGVGHTILFRASRNSSLYQNKRLWNTVVTYWNRKNGSPHQAFTSLLDNGFPSQADTLYSVFDKQNAVEVHDLIRWAEVKNVTGDYTNIPKLFYRNLRGDPGYQLIALSMLSGMLEELARDDAYTMVNSFYELCNPLTFKDAAQYSRLAAWFIDEWGKLNAWSPQIDFVNKYLPDDKRGVALYEVAQKYFARKKYECVLPVASAAFHSAKPEMRDRCAELVFQSCAILNRPDSALLWISRIKNLSGIDAVGVIPFLQKNEALQKSGELISLLPGSFKKDTLQIAQHICRGELSEALDRVVKSQFAAEHSEELRFWMLRIYLFSNNLTSFTRLLDSLKTDPHPAYSAEMLQYRYWVQLLNHDTDLLALWSTIEYNNFMGKPAASGAALCSQPGDDVLFRALLLWVVKETIRQTPEHAAELFLRCNIVGYSAEFDYLKAEAFALAGKRAAAREIAESLLLKYPGDIFAQKARLLISQELTGED
jgi:hypothetical protein